MIFGTQSKCSIFQYYDIGLFSIAPHLVIAFPREREREKERDNPDPKGQESGGTGSQSLIMIL